MKLTHSNRYHPLKSVDSIMYLAEVVSPSGNKWYDLVRSIDPCSAQSKVERLYRKTAKVECKVYISTIIE